MAHSTPLPLLLQQADWRERLGTARLSASHTEHDAPAIDVQGYWVMAVERSSLAALKGGARLSPACWGQQIKD